MRAEYDADRRLKLPDNEGAYVVYLPPSLYDAAERAGCDMCRYRKTEVIPSGYKTK